MANFKTIVNFRLWKYKKRAFQHIFWNVFKNLIRREIFSFCENPIFGLVVKKTCQIDNFYIELDKPNPFYFSGETLSGRLIVRCRERLKIKNIHVDIVGVAKVFWKDRSFNRGTRYYKNNETYMKFSVVSLAKQYDNDLYLECGDYNYPFQIQLPPNLPPSFQHQIGKIRYYVKVTIDIPW